MIEPFVHAPLPVRVIFGAGAVARLPEEVERLGGRRALVLSTPGRAAARAQELALSLRDRSAGLFAGAVMHTPVDVTEQALALVRERGVDTLVAFGGGSTTGLAKALALRLDLPQIVLPTTYAGSEMTPILGETSGGMKTTRSDPRILPETVIYDVELSLALPPAVAAVSGMNAIAHAAEALYARDRSPVIALLAEEGVRALAQALPGIVAHPEDRDARAAALYGAWLCGTCLGSVGMALHHKLCHVLGGTFGLPHAETHTAVLPHAIAYNAPAAPEAMARLAAALGVADAALGLHELAARLGAGRGLRDLGLPQAGVAQAVAQTLANPYWNPRPLAAEALTGLLERAWRGDPPASD